MIPSGLQPVSPPQMLDELFFVPEVVWTYVWQINCFFLQKSSRYPWRQCCWNPKKKFCGWRRQKKVLRTAPAEGLSSWTVHGLSNMFMNMFMNMFKFLLRIFGYFQTLEPLLNLFMNSSWTCSKKENNLDWKHWGFGSRIRYPLALKQKDAGDWRVRFGKGRR